MIRHGLRNGRTRSAKMIANVVIAAVIHVWVTSGPCAVVQFLEDSVPLVACACFAVLLYCYPRFGKWVLYKWAFGYDVRPWHLIATILVVIIVCSVLFWLAYPENLLLKSDSAKPLFTCQYLNGAYFSVITFATVGYGDVRAIGWAASLAMVEGLLGIVLNAALIVVIFRKLIR